LKIYERGGKVTGVIIDDIKHRFKGLGYEQKSLDRLDRSVNPGKELNEIRGTNKEDTKEMKQDKSRDEELQEFRNNEQERSEEFEVED